MQAGGECMRGAMEARAWHERPAGRGMAEAATPALPAHSRPIEPTCSQNSSIFMSPSVVMRVSACRHVQHAQQGAARSVPARSSTRPGLAELHARAHPVLLLLLAWGRGAAQRTMLLLLLLLAAAPGSSREGVPCRLRSCGRLAGWLCKVACWWRGACAYGVRAAGMHPTSVVSNRHCQIERSQRRSMSA